MALAALLWSLAGILQRQLHMSLASQLAGRAIIAFFAILILVAIVERGHLIGAFRALGRPGLAVAVLMATATSCFVTALNNTSVANVLVIQALTPLAAALLGLLTRERVRPPMPPSCVSWKTSWARCGCGWPASSGPRP